MTPTAQIAAIRQRYVSRSQVSRLTVMDAGRVHDDICAIVAAWDARESAIRALVAQWRELARETLATYPAGSAEHGFMQERASGMGYAANTLERLLESEP